MEITLNLMREVVSKRLRSGCREANSEKSNGRSIFEVFVTLSTALPGVILGQLVEFGGSTKLAEFRPSQYHMLPQRDAPVIIVMGRHSKRSARGDNPDLARSLPCSCVFTTQFLFCSRSFRLSTRRWSITAQAQSWFRCSGPLVSMRRGRDLGNIGRHRRTLVHPGPLVVIFGPRLADIARILAEIGPISVENGPDSVRSGSSLAMFAPTLVVIAPSWAEIALNMAEHLKIWPNSLLARQTRAESASCGKFGRFAPTSVEVWLA